MDILTKRINTIIAMSDGQRNCLDLLAAKFSYKLPIKGGSYLFVYYFGGGQRRRNKNNGI